MSNNFLKAQRAQDQRSLIYCAELWQVHKYNRKKFSNLKFILCTRSEGNLLFTLELSSLVALSKHWL